MKTKKFLVILLIFTLLIVNINLVSANSILQKIEVLPNSIGLFLNNKEVKIDNFVYNGTTYVPVREIANITGMDIKWNSDTNRIDLYNGDDYNMTQSEKNKIADFFNQKDENGITNSYKATANSKIIRRVATTDKNKSTEEVNDKTIDSKYPIGVVLENGKLIGLGIHIYNEDVYPLQSFEIYLRNCDLVGRLDISDCNDMVFLDLYNNRLSSVNVGNMASMRILGLQNNQIEELDPTGLPVCQGIDIGKNKLKSLDVSKNSELVELYINDNDFTEIDLSHNQKLKYFYCHNNHITKLDTTNNPLLRHMDATGNPMKQILSFAPQRDEKLPLNLTAGDGGCVGLKFNPVYNAQWKETGEWQQSYYAYPDNGKKFEGWFDEKDNLISTEAIWIDAYGTSRTLTAKFK